MKDTDTVLWRAKDIIPPIATFFYVAGMLTMLLIKHVIDEYRRE